MLNKRPWFFVVTLSTIGAALVIGSEKSHPASASNIIDPTCVSASPCIEYKDNGTGPGMQGTSAGGNGAVGLTFLKSTSATNGHAGLFGGDYSSSGSFNSGIQGISTRGTGVTALSTNGIGARAISTNFVGMSVVGGFSPSPSLGNHYPALSIAPNGANPGGAVLIVGCNHFATIPCTVGEAVFEVDEDGSTFIFGGGGFSTTAPNLTSGVFPGIIFTLGLVQGDKIAVG